MTFDITDRTELLPHLAVLDEYVHEATFEDKIDNEYVELLAHVAAFDAYDAELLPHAATLDAYDAELLPHAATLDAYDAELLPHAATFDENRHDCMFDDSAEPMLLPQVAALQE